MTDILSLFVSNQITVSSIKKIYRVTFIIIICSIIYSVFDLVEWYFIVDKAQQFRGPIHNYFYRYTVWPVVAVILISLSLIAKLLNYKGYGYFLASIKNNDASLLHKAFSNIYISLLLILLDLVISIINIGYRSLFLNS